jgi:hypothetical protein
MCGAVRPCSTSASYVTADGLCECLTTAALDEHPLTRLIGRRQAVHGANCGHPVPVRAGRCASVCLGVAIGRLGSQRSRAPSERLSCLRDLLCVCGPQSSGGSRWSTPATPPRFRYRRIAWLLREEAWRASDTRIYRQWHREGLKVPQKKRHWGTSANGCVRRRVQHKDHLWCWDYRLGLNFF